MLEHFIGKDGRAALLNALRGQLLIDGNSEIADKIASAVRLRQYATGDTLFTQGERGGDLYLILAGRVSVCEHGRVIASCGPGMHVGEVALLEPYKGHATTAIAVEDVVAALITGQKFGDIARHHPELWRRMALTLARRLSELQAAA